MRGATAFSLAFLLISFGIATSRQKARNFSRLPCCYCSLTQHFKRELAARRLGFVDCFYIRINRDGGCAAPIFAFGVFYRFVNTTPKPTRTPGFVRSGSAPCAPRSAFPQHPHLLCRDAANLALAPPQERIASTKSKHCSAAALQCRSLTQSKVQKRKPPHTRLSSPRMCPAAPVLP